MESTYLTPEESPLEGEEFEQEELIEEEQELPEEGAPGGSERIRAAVDSDPFDDPFFTKAHGGRRQTAYRQEEHSGEPQERPADEKHRSRADSGTLDGGGRRLDRTAERRSRPAREDNASGNTELEDGRSASHKVDPLPPSEFRLFGMGGKKKSEDEQPATVSMWLNPVESWQSAGGSAAAVSTFAPGSGLVEEELIEGEEYDTPKHHHARHDEHDLDDYEEEEKLHTQIRSGEIGEMLQEAHLDHKIQLNFDDKNGDDELEIEEEEEEEEGEQPATQEGAPAPGRERRDRGRRGQRGEPSGPPQWPPPIAPLRADLGPAHHQRTAEAGAGDSGADRQGADRQEGRAHHQPHRAARPLPGVHAHRDPRRRQPQDCLRRGTAAAEARPYQ